MSDDLDMQEIFGIFFEECAEGLDEMESGLLGLDPGAADTEAVNTIFRAAHSIKGGAATFGFTAISDFTHGVETLLDQVRDGERAVDQALVDTLLAAVDCLREMLEAQKCDAEPGSDKAAAVKERIGAILASEPGFTAPTDSPTGPLATWRIELRPPASFFRDGNDPLKIFDALATLGELSVECHVDDLPDLDALQPAECHLGWTLELTTDAGRQAIEETFSWIGDGCALDIRELGAEAASPVSAQERVAARESGSIRVAVDKVDTMLNLVGELVITQSMLKRCGEEYSTDNIAALQDGLMNLERYTRELQESAMQIRMLPINVSFSRFPRLVRDLSAKLGKKVDLRFSGEATELDKNVLEKMSDPLVHLVRNSLDHRIETPEKRVKACKPETGVLHLSAAHENGNIVIRVEDDGAGLDRKRILERAIERGLVDAGETLSDEQIDHLIFHPGFSTAAEVSDVSGRGVGMDVVRSNIKELSGRLDVKSVPGRGSVFSICLPLTLAILDGQLARVGRDVYIFALQSIVETVQVEDDEIRDILDAGRVYRLRDQYIPVVRLRDVFNLPPADATPESELLVIVESDGQRMGIFVDDLVEQQQVVIKSLEENYRKVDGLAGATILGDGRVALIVDVAGLMHRLIDTHVINLASQSAAA